MSEVADSPLNHTYLNVGIGIHRFWLSLATFLSGIHAGFSVAYYIFVIENRTPNSNLDVNLIATHHFYFVTIYSFCVFVCTVLVLDRFDFNHLNMEHVVDIILHQLNYLVIPVYLACLIVHAAATPVDEKFLVIESAKVYPMTHSDIVALPIYCGARCFLTLIGWWFVALHRNRDLLEMHLKNLEKYLPEQEETPIEEE